MDVLGDRVVRVWEVVEGGDGVVLLWLPILTEVVMVPGHAETENCSGSYSQKVAESESVIHFRICESDLGWERQQETLLYLLPTPKLIPTHKQKSSGVEGMVTHHSPYSRSIHLWLCPQC